MSCKCRICNSNDVENYGDICESCANGTSYIASGGDDASQKKAGKVRRRVLLDGGSALFDADPFEKDTTKVLADGAAQDNIDASSNTASNSKTAKKASAPRCVSSGTTRNLSVDRQKKSFIGRWIRSLTKGVCFTFDDEVTLFQVFPNDGNTALNSMGNACDQVIVYGKLNNGAISENNDVEIFGRRDSDNNVIAKMIRNKSTGTMITPARTIESWLVWVLTAVFAVLVYLAVSGMGIKGIVASAVLVLFMTRIPFILKIAIVIFALWLFFSGGIL